MKSLFTWLTGLFRPMRPEPLNAHGMLFIALLTGGSVCLNGQIAFAQSEPKIFDVVRHGTAEELKNLLDKQPLAAQRRDEFGYSPLILAAYHGQAEMVAMLAPLDDVNYASGNGTALLGVSVKGDTLSAGILLAHGADPNFGDAEATTPLIFASMMQHVELARLLLLHGANPSVKNKKGFSAVDYAQMLKNTELIILFENHSTK